LNDKADAFRHAFFNAINTRDCITSILPASVIVKLFGDAHESEVPPNLQLEAQMDIHNNDVGINQCISCIPVVNSNDSIKNSIIIRLNNGELWYLKPIDYSGYNTDPNFWDNPNTPILGDGHHGISPVTMLFPTNQ
jgi:hypothetical protein